MLTKPSSATTLHAYTGNPLREVTALTDSPTHNGAAEVSAFDVALRDGVANVLESLEAERAELQRLEREVALARERVRHGERVLYALDPDLRPKSEKTGKPNSNDQRYKITDEKIDKVEAWIRANIGPERTFAAVDIEKAEDGPRMSSATIAVAVRRLHERGVLVLDSIGGGPRQSRRKNYRIAS
jgi:hypothetical protein